MSAIEKFSKTYQKIFPGPFTIAVLLTLVTFVGALFLKPETSRWGNYMLEITGYWEEGLWDPSKGGLYFAFQMMLMLVLGHVLALSRPVSILIDKVTVSCKSTASSAFFISFTTLIVAFFNWGLALIFGAILARKVGEKFATSKKALNYGLIGACGYVGLMSWHGGLSGSAPLKAAEAGNLQGMLPGNGYLPDSVSISETILSSGNLIVYALLLVIIPACMYFLGKRMGGEIPEINPYTNDAEERSVNVSGAEKIEHYKYPGFILGVLLLFYCVYKLAVSESRIDPNFINLALFGFCLLAHMRISSFLRSVEQAIVGAGGILIQFPLYFGIIGIMKSSGMIELISDGFITYSSSESFPFFTFVSAGLVNIFVPSGGGQWAVQGPIIIQAAQEMGISYGKIIMALSYGDQLTNMLQPFWALPLLGITGLKAQKILPYTLILFLIGLVIFTVGIFIF